MKPEREGAYRDGAEYTLQGGIALLREGDRAETIDARFMAERAS